MGRISLEDGRAAENNEKIKNRKGTAEKEIMIKRAMLSKGVPIESQSVGHAI